MTEPYTQDELYESRAREPEQDEQDWLRAEQDEQDWLRAAAAAELRSPPTPTAVRL